MVKSVMALYISVVLKGKHCGTISNFHSGKVYKVMCDRNSSSRHKINPGVLQGSALVPFNKLVSLTELNIHGQAVSATLSSDLDFITEQGASNLVKCNASKIQ